MKQNGKIVIAIDGYSSSGKSTMARELAALLGYTYIDSGAMYRAVTLYALRNGIAGNGRVDREKMTACLPDIRIEFRLNPATGDRETWLNGENVEKEIRQLPVSDHVSPVATIGAVREFLVARQREMGKSKGVIMDGRDIGTVVFPGAELKVFVTAKPEIRALRRYRELTGKGEQVSYEYILNNVIARDKIDSQREISPLRKADDAIVLDNSEMTPEEQIAWMVARINERFD